MSAAYFETRERALLGDRYPALYTARGPLARSITINTLRCTPERFVKTAQMALEPSPFCENNFFLCDTACRPGRHPYHHAGVYYVQEASASVVAGLLQVRPGEKVLDLCAAPGGKTSQLAAALQGDGLLVANEFAAPRAAVLKGNLERMGVTNALVLNEDTARVAAAFPRFFDKVLVDAPCSGEGMFRKEPQAIAQHSAALVRACAQLGAKILENAAACVAPGGLLAYSTCTFAPEEDEGQVASFLAAHPEFELLPVALEVGSPGEPVRCIEARGNKIALPAGADISFTRRIYPCHGGEGHFMALLRRSAAQYAASSTKKAHTKSRTLRQPLPKACTAFFQRLFPDVPLTHCACNGDAVYLLPAVKAPVTKLRVVQQGVWAGNLVKERFVPAHHLFMAYGAHCANAERLTCEDARCAAWLRGEEIEAKTADPGYAAVLVDGYPLGFGKQSGGKIKNHYPKGLRNLK